MPRLRILDGGKLVQHSSHSHTTYVSLDRIRRNYRLLCRAAEPSEAQTLPPASLPAPGGEIAFPWPDIMPVIKADAYGHGHAMTARTLLEEGARLFASGSVHEAAMLRRELCAPPGTEHKEAACATPGAQASSGNPAVVSLLGVMSGEDAATAARWGIIPVIHSLRQLSFLEKSPAPLAVALKCDSGMSRLGFEENEIPGLLQGLRKLPHIMPVLALSHLCCADTEQGLAETQNQARAFARSLKRLRAGLPHIAASLGNSAGTLLAKEITEILGPHICRPGIAVYGGNPFCGTSYADLGKGLSTAMSVSAPVMAVRELSAGQSIGYGRAFTAARAMRAAIVAVGYADAYPRSLSNRGELCVRGGRAPVLGRVSMQMTAIDVSDIEHAAPGDEAWLLGGPHGNGIGAEELARMWGTITYEVFCLLGNGARIYT